MINLHMTLQSLQLSGYWSHWVQIDLVLTQFYCITFNRHTEGPIEECLRAFFRYYCFSNNTD